MKTITNVKKGSRIAWSPYILPFKSLILSAMILTGIQANLKAQEVQYTRLSWWFGVAAGANINFYQGYTQHLNSDLTVPTAFRHGNGVGLFVAPLVEYHRPDSRWGFMLQAGYDSRKGKFEPVFTPCNCPADLSTNLSYITIEPSLRIAPFKSDFYLFAGPRLAFNLKNSFTNKLGKNPAIPDQVPPADVKGDFSDMNKMLISVQVGAGYDIQLSSQHKQTQWALSPFVSFHPYSTYNKRMEYLDLEKPTASEIVNNTEYISNAVETEELMQNSAGNVSSVSSDSGEELTGIVSPDSFIQVIDGKAEINEKSDLLETGQSFIIPAYSRNKIKTNARFKMISNIIKKGYDEIS